MYSEPNDKFIERCYKKNDSQILFRLNNDKNNYDVFCIVEGPSDQYFYKNINNYKPCLEEADYIWVTNYNNDKEIGKEAVIKAYFDIKETPDLNRMLSKTIFIVDNDYYGFNSEKYDDDTMKNIANLFTITKGYSFENYFLIRENISNIFSILNLRQEDFEKFINRLDLFILDLREFNSLKSTIVSTCKVDVFRANIGKTTIYKNDEIFIFDFNCNPFYNRNLLMKQISSMKEAVRSNSVSSKVYSIQKNKYYSEPEYGVYYTRGHDVYKFLTTYLNQIHNKNIDYKQNYDLYKKIVSKISVEIDLKFGDGKKIT